METDLFIWHEPSGSGRNRFCRFRQEFELDAVSDSATINLFADSRYRLWVNGTFIGYGPVRFVPAHPEYDTYDLAPHLTEGDNTILVEVTSFGSNTFQSTRDSRAGFIAWGEVAGIDLSTPGNWQCSTSDAWDSEAPAFTFALGAAEILDTRKQDSNEWHPPCPVGNQKLWGKREPRSVPYPSLEKLKPDALTGPYNIANDEQIIGFRQYDPAFDLEAEERRWTRYECQIHSSEEQTVEIGIFWGNHFLNGQPLECRNDERRGNRQNTTLHLSKGWNQLNGEVEQLEEVWGFFLGIPRNAGLTVRDLRHTELLPSADSHSNDWKTVPIDAEPQLPARIRAWDLPVEKEETGIQSWVYEFKNEFDGFVVVEVDAPEGAILDIGYDDWLRDDGLINLYGTNPFVNTIDRYILKGGTQRIQGFHVRGGHYLQLTLTGQGTINDVHVLSANPEFPMIGSFECSDPILSKVWNMSARTLEVSTEDSYSDCPWRERGTYLGDGYVNIHMHRMLNCDTRIQNRFLRLFAQSQFGNGQMPSSAPSWMQTSLEDYTLIWILCLHDYWVMTQDSSLVEELWPTVETILASPEWQADETGLWNADHLNLFIDWGVLPGERRGKGNAALNAFRIRALENAAALAPEDRARELRSEALVVREAFVKNLWIEEEGRYAPSLGESTTALHANILALLFNIGDTRKVCSYVKEQLNTNLTRENGQAEYYFLFYALEALYQNGEAAFAEQLIRDHWGLMLENDSGTLWECFSRGMRQVGSRCHSWAGAPLVTAIRHTLGVRQRDPLNPDKLVIAPNVETIDWARGTYPHPKGDIRVEWKKVDGRIEISLSAPRGIEVESTPI
ncbi:hypothetical protein PDESU_05813 [Pontiella desulfatans]|uniref:Alpha-L-rhamnosidase n=1 Tax=Pontiella desulfatans TaxID=2750659 RepID=A0A6C2UC97_PONDE|nr:alpha-L-rhamnosidase C-terminal domain-containing protein [Pontiella desulfatans]VGO17217.1 hypothetical protein PDESU_05813 [Pontiella desulfatans]